MTATISNIFQKIRIRIDLRGYENRSFMQLMDYFFRLNSALWKWSVCFSVFKILAFPDFVDFEIFNELGREHKLRWQNFRICIILQKWNIFPNTFTALFQMIEICIEVRLGSIPRKNKIYFPTIENSCQNGRFRPQMESFFYRSFWTKWLILAKNLATIKTLSYAMIHIVFDPISLYAMNIISLLFKLFEYTWLHTNIHTCIAHT